MKTLFSKKKRPSDEMALQITSMADIFTILLVFLLKSYATGTVNLAPSAGLILPEAHASDLAVDTLKVEVSQSAVQVEGKAIAALQDFRFTQEDLDSAGGSKSLKAALAKERERQLLIAKSNTDVKVDPKILIAADQRVPYSTIKTVLASAAINGYTDFKLATVRGE